MIEPFQFSTSMTAIVVTLVLAAWNDWTRWRVPNRLLGVSASIALVLALFMPSSPSVADCLLGGLTGVALFLPHYLMRGMAAGDVKLLGVVGMHAGAQMVLEIALVTMLVGGVWALAVLVLRKVGRLPPRVAGLNRQMSASKYAGELRDLPDWPPRNVRYLAIPYGVVTAIGMLLILIASML